MRISYLDYLRGVLITLMVIGHTGSLGSRYIYLFHIPAFIFLSGIIVGEKHNSSRLLKSIKKIYSEFLKYSFLYLIFRNLIIEFGLINRAKFNYGNYLYKIFDILSFRGLGELLGAFWYLTVYSEILILTYILNKVLSNVRFRIGVSFLICWFGFFLANQKIEIYYYLDLVFILQFFFEIGRLCTKKLNLISKLKHQQLILGLILLVSLFLISNLYQETRVDIAIRILPEFSVFLFYSILGILLVSYISITLDKYNLLGTTFRFLGKNTIPILALHFFGFKVLDYLLVKTTLINHNLLSKFPTSLDSDWQFAIYYSIGGLLIPIILTEAVRIAHGYLKKIKLRNIF